MIYTAWGSDGVADTLIEGEGPPRFAGGAQDSGCPQQIRRIEAESWEDACRQYHELQGWEPYQPM